MKVTIHYDLPEELRELEEALFQGPKAMNALNDIYQYLRSQTKWADQPDDAFKIYDNFFEILNNHGVELL